MNPKPAQARSGSEQNRGTSPVHLFGIARAALVFDTSRDQQIRKAGNQPDVACCNSKERTGTIGNCQHVDLGGTESYRESKGYRPGTRAVTAETPWGLFGLTTCYDMRFPALYRSLAEAGATILTAPSAFTVPTGRAHWEVLLRARAIETGSFVIAAAQWGTHAATRGRVRETWGHSLVVGPWGEVLADAREGTGATLVEINPTEAAEARAKIPALANARDFVLAEPN